MFASWLVHWFEEDNSEKSRELIGRVGFNGDGGFTLKVKDYTDRRKQIWLECGQFL